MPFSSIRLSSSLFRSGRRGSFHLVEESPVDRTVGRLGFSSRQGSRERASVIFFRLSPRSRGIDGVREDRFPGEGRRVVPAGTKERPRSKKAEWLAEFRGSAKSKLIWSPLLLKL